MTIANGTRKGAILSPIFWAVYADPLLQRLRAIGLGVHVAGLFMGAVCYADDVLVKAPTRNVMQRMLVELELFAGESNITQFPVSQRPSVSLLLARSTTFQSLLLSLQISKSKYQIS